MASTDLAKSTRTAKTLAEVYRGFIQRGFPTEEAARLTAATVGLPVQVGNKVIRWKIVEINRLMFLAALHDQGKLE